MPVDFAYDPPRIQGLQAFASVYFTGCTAGFSDHNFEMQTVGQGYCLAAHCWSSSEAGGNMSNLSQLGV